ncbi:MAG: GNAT family N-acetyltransferase [Caldilineaceae bacterium]|nr:GNAT family N-acetyltransferase [Caldilineaceae bacterium]
MNEPLPRGWHVRPPTLDDVDTVVALINAWYVAIGDPPEMSSQELRKDWHTIDLAEQACLIVDADGAVVAQADIFNRRYRQVNIYIHIPPHPHEELMWSYLLQWGESWAASHAHLGDNVQNVEVHHFMRAPHLQVANLLEARGYGYVRTHYVMQIALTDAPPDPVWPAGIGVRSFRPGVDDDALFAAGEESFQDMWNRPPSTKERWLLPTQGPSFDPLLWFLAYVKETNDVVGVGLCSIIAGSGEVDTLGIRRPWRQQGVGLALLQHALGEFFRRDITTVALSVDAASPTGAPRLYARAGFTVEKTFHRYVKQVAAGRA